MKEKKNLLKEKKEKIELGGGDKRIEAQHKKGKKTARERLQQLFDDGSFQELDMFVKTRCTSFSLNEKEIPNEGVITAYGTINGRLVHAFAQDFTVMGGSLGEMHAQKICKIQDRAMKMGTPLIGLNDSGGARIQEGVNALKGYGDIFYRNTKASGVIPQFSVILGPCAGGAVYSPALTDFVFMVKNTSQMFITGPQVIKTVTGEDIDVQSLGGADIHNIRSGNAHFVDENEENCFDRIRKLLSFLPDNNLADPPEINTDDSFDRTNEIIEETVPVDPNKSYDIRTVIEDIVDNNDFLEVHPLFAGNIVVGFARLAGKSIGIIANQPNVLAGCLDINASDKAARFVRLCDAFNIPILTICDVPGYLPGIEQEHGGIIRHGAKLLYAYSEATVPLVTVIVRKAYGGAYIAMGSAHLGADMVFAYPTAEIAVMGPQGAANIVFRREIQESDNPDKILQEKISEYRDSFANPYKAAEYGYVDDIIDPVLTRSYLINSFNALVSKREERPMKKHGNIPL